MGDLPKLVVFVHGWSVRSTGAYGALPARLEREAKADPGLGVDVRHLWLGQYVSFRDDVRMEDLARAFEAAVRRELGSELDRGRRFACITHSTGGPVVREWWDRHYLRRSRSGPCPMSHLIMLAPPHFGSALAQLGKGRLSRVRAWFQGVEPGQRVLDWLELGSAEAGALQRAWIDTPDPAGGSHPVFLFSLASQRVDHRLYDHVNAYTGELGSDGVVRVASANLNATHVRLVQEAPRSAGARGRSSVEAPALRQAGRLRAPRTAFTLVPGCSHSGRRMGILESVRDDDAPHPTVARVLDCLRVDGRVGYRALCDAFDAITADVQRAERIEKQERLLPDRWFIHDPAAMVTFRLADDHGHPLERYDLKLLAGNPPSPDRLPQGFFRDRQRNSRDPGALTYFFNQALMAGSEPVVAPDGTVLRGPRPGAERLGVRIEPHDDVGPVHHLPAEWSAAPAHLRDVLRPNETTVVEVVMRRVVREGAFRLTRDRRPRDFHRDPDGPVID